MLVVGLTGGIGSGKTTVSRRFAALGVPVIDADLIARELVTPGSAILDQIVRRFGSGVLSDSGELDRSRLRELVFSNQPARRDLEAMLHPAVRQEIERRTARLRAPYCILVIPLLVETGQLNMVHRVLVVDVPEAAQIGRTSARDRVSHQSVRSILAAQARRAQRLAAADDVIDNSGTREALETQIRRLHETYLSKAAAAAVCQNPPSAGE